MLTADLAAVEKVFEFFGWGVGMYDVYEYVQIPTCPSFNFPHISFAPIPLYVPTVHVHTHFGEEEGGRNRENMFVLPCDSCFGSNWIPPFGLLAPVLHAP